MSRTFKYWSLQDSFLWMLHYLPSVCSRVQFFATLWTVAHQAPLSMGFSRQEHWGESPFPTSQPRDQTQVSCISCIGRQLLYLCMCVPVFSVASIISDSLLWIVAGQVLCPWDSPGKNTGVSCNALLKGIFLTQGSNPHHLCLLHCRQILYPLSPLGSIFSTWVTPRF